uniref:Uncharacterized protein n=1 Tax=Romanomermis culicivorax TaxID=13658 RepID=A0A915JRK1_ROMCU
MLMMADFSQTYRNANQWVLNTANSVGPWLGGDAYLDIGQWWDSSGATQEAFRHTCYIVASRNYINLFD